MPEKQEPPTDPKSHPKQDPPSEHQRSDRPPPPIPHEQDRSQADTKAHSKTDLPDRQHAEHPASEASSSYECATNPVFHPSKPTKILLSPGEGAGWVSWAPRTASDAFLLWMLTYQPLIKGLERREHRDKLEDMLRDFHREAHMRFNVERIVTSRVGDLVVEEVKDPFEVRDNDGMEKIVDVSRRKTLSM